jgi:hypothetical protein
MQNISFIYQLFVVGTQFSVNRVPAFSCLRYFISQEHLTGVLSFGATKWTHFQPQEVSSLVLQIELTCNHNEVSSSVLQKELTRNHRNLSWKHKMENTNFKASKLQLLFLLCGAWISVFCFTALVSLICSNWCESFYYVLWFVCMSLYVLTLVVSIVPGINLVTCMI